MSSLQVDAGEARKLFFQTPHLLCKTFMYSTLNEIASPSLTSTPLQLILVCKVWKLIAENIPALWCRFRLDIKPGSDFFAIERYCKVLERFIELSKGHPLDVAIIFPSNKPSSWERYALQELYRTLYSQQYRWSEISIRLPYDVFGPILFRPDHVSPSFNLASSTVRNLHLDLSIRFAWVEGSVETLVPSFTDCIDLEDLIITGQHQILPDGTEDRNRQAFSLKCPPNLHTLELRDVFFRPNMITPNAAVYNSAYDLFPTLNSFWQALNVRKLVLVNVEVLDTEVYDNLYFMFPSLVWLDIQFTYHSNWFERNLDRSLVPVQLAGLRRLSLLIREWKFLNSIWAPDLKVLDLEEGGLDVTKYNGPSSYRPTHLRSDMLTGFISRCRIKLEIFHLSALKIDEEELIKILPFMKELKELRVAFRGTAVSDTPLFALSERSKSGQLLQPDGQSYVRPCKICPVLSTLSLESDSATQDRLSMVGVICLINSREVRSNVGRGNLIAWKELSLPIPAAESDSLSRIFNVNLRSTLPIEL